ncbi:MAG: VanZ family protein [Firmicutes bacterium]|nr:VanZ family protein [Bacillota bacterium]
MKKFIKLLLIILCMMSIFMFSSDSGDKSTGKSDSIILHGIKFFTGRELNDKEKQIYIDKFVMPVRKSAHFFIYFILGVLVISYCKEFNFNYKIIFISILICFLYSISDEVHQLFVSGRSCQIFDIFIDTIGSSLGSICYYICYNKYIKYKEKKYE